ncbi:protein phosphatase methylesterase 1-like isoform X2 [Eriocheir sinensis]|uniref:protein phosphatase methylesterase 1-like isoform X2 n=1 Tax=Eriocheir sinensis TaxID=95602 RepID=UPI0021CA9B37|nr:protein phosphatase methylesterase 1-like isoform X2 [Eriocheir sinensis]
MSAARRELLKNVLPPMGSARRGRASGGLTVGGRRDYTPVSWRKYWDICKDVTLEDGDVFRVYQRGSEGPLLVLLHGGGYSALTWSLFAECVTEMVECQVLAVDQRGHGDTTTSDDTDLSAATMASDVGRVVETMYGSKQPPCVLIGHSMGGAVAVHTAYDQHMGGLAGLVVIDVVEGTAMDALSSMQSFLRGRPHNFNSLQNAVEWSVRSGQTRNVEAARVSMPGQVKNLETGKCGTVDLETMEEAPKEIPADGRRGSTVRADVIMEEGSEGDASNENSLGSENNLPVTKYTWRINLGETEKFWPGWFQGLSTKFLSSNPAKMLLLAGIDRLDTDLTVGQMQGKFQMQVLPQCGHAVQEDTPDRVAEVLATFLLRHKLAVAKAEFHRSFPAC